jgi:NAD(P)-dependent dehydrogenase (short-subunit alcohol dehydrogenase family)
MTTTLITGANTGIGAETARGLAKRGHVVFFACRSEAKTRPVMDAITRETGNPHLHFLELHLDDLQSVRACAAKFKALQQPLHVLVLNAGVTSGPPTKQNFEPCFGVNHLGHFLLTLELESVLRASAPARVVVVASRAHERVRTPLDRRSLTGPQRSRSGWPEYQASKLANMLFALELTKRLKDARVDVHALHPGVIASDLWRSFPWPIRPLVKLLMRSPERGAISSLHCATADGLNTGGYYGADAEPRERSALARDEAAAKWLWDYSTRAIAR